MVVLLRAGASGFATVEVLLLAAEATAALCTSRGAWQFGHHWSPGSSGSPHRAQLENAGVVAAGGVSGGAESCAPHSGQNLWSALMTDRQDEHVRVDTSNLPENGGLSAETEFFALVFAI